MNAASEEPPRDPAPDTGAMAGFVAIGSGLTFLAGAMLVLVGYSMAESDNVALLLTWLVPLVVVGGVCIAAGRAILRA